MRVLFAIALAATLLAGPASRANGAPKSAKPAASAGPATLRSLNSLLADGRYGAAVAPALELAGALGSGAARDTNATSILDRVVSALLAGGHGADSATIHLAARTMRAHEGYHGAGGLPTGAATTAWARCLAARRDDRAATVAFERGLAIEVARSAPDSLRVAESLEWSGRAQIERGDAAGASGPIVRSLAIRELALGAEHREVARSLDALAVDLFALGDYTRARAAAERALAIREKALPSRHPEIAESLDHLGAILEASVEWGDDKMMRGLLKFVRNKVQPKHSTFVWDLFNSATESNYQPKDFARAGRSFDRALAIRTNLLGPHHPETATSALALGRHRQVLGNANQAMGHMRRALATREQVYGGAHPAVAEALVAIGDLLVDNRDPVSARTYFERALAIQGRTSGPDDREVAGSLLGIARALAAVGDAHPAAEYARRALAIREKTLDPTHPLVAEALITVADLEHEIGDDAAADPHYVRAIDILEQVHGKEHPRVADACEARALACRDRGELEVANILLVRALHIREKAFGDNHPDVGRALNELVWVNSMSSGPRERLARACAIFAASYGSGHPVLARCWRDQALIDWYGGAGDSATFFDAITAEEQRHQVLMTSLSSLPERQALALSARTPRVLDLALTVPFDRYGWVTPMLNTVISARGLVLDELGVRRLGALDSDTASVRLAEQYREASGRLASLMVRGHGSQSAGFYRQLIVEAEHDREQSERALGDRAGTIRDRMRRSGLQQVDRALAKGAAIVSFVRYQRYEFVKAESRVGPKAKKKFFRVLEEDPEVKKASFRASKEPLRAGEYRLIPSYIAIVTRRDVKTGGTFSNLKKQFTSDDTFDFSSRVWRGVARLGDAAEIDSLVARWVDAASHRPLRQPRDRADETILSVGQALRKRVWDPILKSLGASERVFVVPDGALQLINFAALPAADGSYLIERPPLIHLLSAERDLALAAASPAAGRKLLAFGGPNFDDVCDAQAVAVRSDDDSLLSRGAPMCVDFGSMRFTQLPATSEEVAEIGRLWRAPGDSIAGEAVALVGSQACEADFKRLAHGNAVIHVATHGFFIAPGCARIATDAAADPSSPEASQTLRSAVNAANPLTLSGLALAGANRRADAPPRADDGILTAQEIAALDLRGTQWAVLSACETGVGEVVSGEGVFGLRRAFQMAGARTIIMSLWSVEDEGTRRWMQLLYEARYTKGMSTAEAVRSASLTQLAQRRESGLSAHPFYWAAFVAAGDWR